MGPMGPMRLMGLISLISPISPINAPGISEDLKNEDIYAMRTFRF